MDTLYWIIGILFFIVICCIVYIMISNYYRKKRSSYPLYESLERDIERLDTYNPGMDYLQDKGYRTKLTSLKAEVAEEKLNKKWYQTWIDDYGINNMAKIDT